MSVFSGGSGVAIVGAAGIAIVGAAAWFEFGRTAPAPQALVQEVAMPQDTAPEQPIAVTPSVAVQTATQAAVPSQETTQAPTEEQSVAPETQAAAAPQTQAAQDPVAEAAVEAPQPQIAAAFDEVRQETDGLTIIAGRATPDAQITVLLDGQEISQTAADGSGKFAAIALIAPDGQGHVLSLLQDGVASDEQIILAPLAAVVVAQAADVAEPVAAEQVAQVVVTEETSTETETPTEVAALDPEVGTNEPEVETDVAPQTAKTPSEAEAPAAVQTATATPEAPAAPQADAAPEEVAVLKSTQDGVELLNVPAPEVMSNVALDTISYSSAGDVQLAGRAQSDATAVRVYLDNNAVVSLQVDDRGRWRGDLPNVDEGIYTLRVDEVSQDGAVTSRVETPFKREAPEVLVNAAQGQSGLIRKITVQKGATLWAIAERRYGDGLLYVNVVKANESDIRNPDLIYPGQVFDLPD